MRDREINYGEAAKRQLLNQAAADFDFYCFGFVASFFLAVASAVMVLTNEPTEAAVSTSFTSAGISSVCSQKRKDAQDKLEKLIAAEKKP